jgi:hypothetical protein
MPEEEVGFLVAYLLGDEAGQAAARRIDRQIDRLPGLDGLHLVEKATAGRTCVALGTAVDPEPASQAA